MQIVAIIPARGGSKGVPGKNIAIVGGKPLIAWTITAAIKANIFDRVIVSTDDATIAFVATQFGAEVPFLRPPHLAQDDTPTIDVLIHLLDWLAQNADYRPDLVMLLQPTSPLRMAEDVREARLLLDAKQADSVVSVCLSEQHPYWMKQVDDDQRLRPFLNPTETHTRRQNLPPTYALNGAIYLAKRELILTQRSFYTDNSYAYIMPPERSLDIDTPWDLHLVDLILRDKKYETV